MRLAGVDRRGKVMLCTAWITSSICSMPQAIIFHVETHPNITHYKQCVTYNFFKNETQEVLYSFMGMILMYALPLIIIIYCYASIYIELYKKSRQCVTGEFERTNNMVDKHIQFDYRYLAPELNSNRAQKYFHVLFVFMRSCTITLAVIDSNLKRKVYLLSIFHTIFNFIDRFRRSNDDVLGRAKRKTLRMTITIVIVFIVSWTPFYVMSVW